MFNKAKEKMNAEVPKQGSKKPCAAYFIKGECRHGEKSPRVPDALTDAINPHELDGRAGGRSVALWRWREVRLVRIGSWHPERLQDVAPPSSESMSAKAYQPQGKRAFSHLYISMNRRGRSHFSSDLSTKRRFMLKSDEK